MTKLMLPSLVAAFVLCSGAAVPQNGLARAEAQSLGLVSYKEPSVPVLATDGTATVAFTIRADGRVADAVTLIASDRKLAEPAREAVLRWRFERDPTFGRGRDAELDKVMRRELVEFVFKRDKVTGMNHREGAKAWFPEGGKPAVRTVTNRELDTPLSRRSLPAGDGAEQPPSRATVAGNASVSFVIDETGRVRVPIVESADSPELTRAALDVVARWHFDPPQQDGQPVLSERRHVLTFGPPQP
jgi:TonB family protein